MIKRELYMDVARALAMFLVIFGHIIVNNDVRGYSASSAQMIYSFHTALFMFVSGWFFPNVLRKDWKTVIKEKACQLLLPYLSWSIICLMLIDLPFSGFDVSSCFSNFLMGGVFHNYWYVKVLFLYIVVSYITIKLCGNKWIGCMACYLFFTIAPGFAFSNIFIPFFLGGFLLKDILKKRSDNKSIFILAVSDLFLFSLWEPDYCYVRENMHLVPYLVRTGIGLCTSCLIILSLMYFYEMKDNLKEKRSSKIVAFWGTITLGIYLSHDLFYKGFLGQIASLFIMEGNLVVLFIYALLVFMASAGLVTLIRKNKYLNFIFLGKKI